MRKTTYTWIYSFIVMGILLLPANSCKEDETINQSNGTGTLTIGDNSYDLVYGELIGIRDVVAGEVYVGPIYLLSTGFSLGNSSVTGIGQVIGLSLFFDSYLNIVPGTYTLDSEEPFPSGTFNVDFYADFNMSTFGISALYRATSGTLTISKIGSTYDMSIDVLASKYNVTHADTEPTGNPLAVNVVISCTFSGDLAQKYFGK
jgi:hypothetical protein